MTATVTGWKRFTLEPLAAIVLLAVSISDNVFTDLILYQTCKSIEAANKSQCEILHINSKSQAAIDLENLVQPHTSLMLMLRSCIETIFPTILSLFLGPWSDRNGRKPLFVFPLIGFTLYYATLAVLSCFDLTIYFYLLPSVPLALLGGYPPVLMTFFCYITDITDQNTRSWRLALLDTAVFVGLLGGLLIGPYVLKNYGYFFVFCLSGFLCLLAVIFTILAIQETIFPQNGRSLRSVFDLTFVKESLCSVTRKKDGFDRCLIWCCIIMLSLHVMIFEGNGAISYLFVSAKLGWNITDFSIYSSTHLLISMSGMLLLIQLAGHILKLPDTVIIVVASLSNCGNYMIKAFAQEPWHMYLSSAVGMFSAAALPTTRSIISKSVSQDDVGKVFSLSSMLEMIVPFATSPLYIYIYTHTLKQYPCPVWFLSAATPLLIILLAVVVEQRWKRLRETCYTPFVQTEDLRE
ncbi:hypothetical protein QAD02_023231 [Eretmocerus hayati]|uniref:Uncharacterized protein n=1 Tax=Eretmocerus hayati TaxID=131215 RepID=A0ACC2PVM1_9HYME|nr:hypothetical protein QAD02_023231 [Eretmocerus hayati]